ncbi:hypothetical protein ACP70R_047661 [Stipagrostis hirtigluma subsp. patula]
MRIVLYELWPQQALLRPEVDYLVQAQCSDQMDDLRCLRHPWEHVHCSDQKGNHHGYLLQNRCPRQFPDPDQEMHSV